MKIIIILFIIMSSLSVRRLDVINGIRNKLIMALRCDNLDYSMDSDETGDVLMQLNTKWN